MADLVNIDWITKPFKDAMDDMDRVTDKATMYALRAVGRKGASAAKKSAPVYTGPPRVGVVPGNLKKSIGNSRTLYHLGTGDYAMKMGPFGGKKKGTVVSYAGQRNGSGGRAGGVGTYTARYNTRTYKPHLTTKRQDSLYGVPLYRQKIQAKTGFMDAAISTMDATAKDTFEAAYAKAYERFK